ncbi:MAG TPA: ATPase, T2SS/T4P/T4SS family [Candidatus Baltobacteraceae bacterium]|nr:ATPase, T2SS/T4P/T4SS family [Candidatus Baltobacteraceae bacterium]
MYNDALLQKILLTAGTFKPAELKDHVAAAKEKHVRLEEYLLEKMPEETLFRLAADYFKVPFVDLKGVQVRKDFLDLVPEPIATTHEIVPFDKGEKTLKVAALDPEDLQTIEFLRRKTGLDIQVHVTTPTALQEIIKQYKRSLKAEFEDIAKTTSTGEGEDDQSKLRELAQDLPVVRIVESLLEHAVFEGASDIHIEPSEQDLVVRYRVDGILRNVMTLPKNSQAGIVARIKVLSNLKLDEHRLPQDGRMKISGPGYKYSVRVSTLPVMDGEKIVMRLLSETAQALSLEQLGFNAQHLELLKRNIMKPHGIIFVTGPTGSGKTTTLYSVLSLRNTPGVNISTIEDPVEYRMTGVNQSQVNPKIGFTFAIGLRTLLRQDPNIIMVGEIRDGETAEIATNAAMTGHLVFATLHTNDAVTSLPRLVDMGVPRFLVAFTCNIIVAQRLVRKICKNCHTPYKLTKVQLKELSEVYDIPHLTGLLQRDGFLEAGQTLDKVDFFHGAGCKQCNGEGYKGRMGIYEVLEISKTLQDLINKDASSSEMLEAAEKEGMIPIVEDGFAKAIQGVTSLEEIMRVTKE